MRFSILIILTIIIPLFSCQTQETIADNQITNQTMAPDNNNNNNNNDGDMIEVLSASITGVEVSGSENKYTFSVTTVSYTHLTLPTTPYV